MNLSTLELIKEAHKYSSQYKNGLSNHLPMALYSLDSLGSSSESIKKFFLSYSRKLELKKESKTEVIDIKNHYGEAHSFSRLVTFFEKKLSNNGSVKVILEVLPFLESGISGAAFHPLIRLAFAVEIGDNTEIAHALASWVIAFQELDGREESTLNLSLTESLITLKNDFSKRDYSPEGYGIFRRMKSASEQVEFSSFYNSFKLDNNSIEEMAKLVLKLYIVSGDNFTALHAVTSCHALRVILSHIGQAPDSLLRYYWEAVGAAYVDTGLPEFKVISVESLLPDWEEIKKSAKLSLNDHVIKLVFTCNEEFKHYNDPLYQFAAAKKVALI